jgi:Ca2+-binding RTX toxin-like protein
VVASPRPNTVVEHANPGPSRSRLPPLVKRAVETHRATQRTPTFVTASAVATRLVVLALIAVIAHPRDASAASLCFGAAATIGGTPGADVIRGTAAADRIAAGAGDDLILGVSGDDQICPGRGSDTVIAGPGRDRVRASRGDDRIFAGRGSDLFAFAVDGGGPGNDRVDGGPGDDIVTGGRGDDFVRGGPGDDSLAISTGSNTYRGGRGHDAASFGFLRGPVIASLQLRRAVAPGLSAVLISAADLFGSNAADTLIGDAQRNEIFAGAGNDILRGLAGDDVLLASQGVDMASGGKGDDVCREAELIASCENTF